MSVDLLLWVLADALLEQDVRNGRAMCLRPRDACLICMDADAQLGAWRMTWWR